MSIVFCVNILKIKCVLIQLGHHKNMMYSMEKYGGLRKITFNSVISVFKI